MEFGAGAATLRAALEAWPYAFVFPQEHWIARLGPGLAGRSVTLFNVPGMRAILDLDTFLEDRRRLRRGCNALLLAPAVWRGLNASREFPSLTERATLRRGFSRYVR